MSTRRVLAVLTTVLVAVGLGLAGPTAADPGERKPRQVRTTISADDTVNPSTATITISGTVSARDRRCVKGRLVTVRGTDSDPVTGEPVVLGTDASSRSGAWAVTISIFDAMFGNSYRATVARRLTDRPRPVACTAAKATGVLGF